MEKNKEYYGFSDYKELLATSTLRESKTMIVNTNEKLTRFAVTINPLAHKRIAHKIPNQKSECKKYMNYTNAEQREILNYILDPFKHLVDGPIFEELTDQRHVHVHATFILSDDQYPMVKERVNEENKRLGDKKSTYTAFDFKIILNDDACAAWKTYASKEHKEFRI